MIGTLIGVGISHWFVENYNGTWPEIGMIHTFMQSIGGISGLSALVAIAVTVYNTWFKKGKKDAE